MHMSENPSSKSHCISSPFSLLTCSHVLLDEKRDGRVRSLAFEEQYTTVIDRHSTSSAGSNDSAHHKLFEEHDGHSDTSAVFSDHDVSKEEQHLFYFNIRGDGRLGPKLIYRTSRNKFTPPNGPENEARPIRLLEVESHAQLGKDNLWATVRDQVRDLPKA